MHAAKKMIRELTGIDKSGHGLLWELGRRVVRRREARGWTRAELAARLGVSRQRLSHWEGGSHTPPLDVLVALRRELGISLDELVTGETPAGSGWTQEVREQVAIHLRELMRLLKPWLETIEADRAETPEEKGS